MSVSLLIQGNLGEPVSANIPSTAGDLFVPTNRVLVQLANITLVNTSAASKQVSLYWSDGTTHTEFYRSTIAANDTVEAKGMPMMLNPQGGAGIATKIRGVESATGNVVKALFTYYYLSAYKANGG